MVPISYVLTFFQMNENMSKSGVKPKNFDLNCRCFCDAMRLCGTNVINMYNACVFNKLWPYFSVSYDNFEENKNNCLF